ncbi:MAG: hypothetical protein IT378_06455 [Sandaracinaceae bacterium]|nr:hypothetical protein [Sandaracinaceae bacterium]
MRQLARLSILLSLAVALGGCQLLVAGISAGITGISAAIQAELESRPVTEQVTETPYVQTASLQENFQILDEDLHARGYASLGQPQDATLATGALHDARLRLGAGECYAVAAVGEPSVSDLAIAIFDAGNHPVEGDISHGLHPVTRTCIRDPGVYTVRLYMREGQGPFRYAAYRWTRGTRGPFGVEGLLYVRVAEATALLEARGYTPDPSFTPIKGSFRREGAQQEHRLAIDEGGCVIVVAVGGPGVRDLDASLATGMGPPASDRDGGAMIALEACASSHQRTELSLASTRGSGEYFFQVFRRDESRPQG